MVKHSAILFTFYWEPCGRFESVKSGSVKTVRLGMLIGPCGILKTDEPKIRSSLEYFASPSHGGLGQEAHLLPV